VLLRSRMVGIEQQVHVTRITGEASPLRAR
jgi:hypothetical protein